MCKLIVAGIGPGDPDSITVGVDKALRDADVIIGYTVYIDLIKERYPGKEYLTTGMTKEVDRCKIALDSALEGKKTVLICSGDSGIYGMAALIYELRGTSNRPDIEVLPGITAACSGSSLLGAPLTHDFVVISLSDRLTNWETIENRLRYAAKADLTIVLYNPSSKSRPDHLKKACDILLQELPGERPCGIAQQIGRNGESSRILTLKELRETPVDMFSTIFIGNNMTRVIEGKMITPRGYHHD